jgi:hypothetical protein
MDDRRDPLEPPTFLLGQTTEETALKERRIARLRDHLRAPSIVVST